jgi:hypothetical protein
MPAYLRFFALPIREQGYMVEAALTLLAVRLAFALLPFPRALRLLRITLGQANAGRLGATEAAVIARVIVRTAQHVPFRAACLQQAFAALLMLRRRGLAVTVHLGLAREAGALKAHAWSRCGETPVTGAELARGFVPVAVFAA